MATSWSSSIDGETLEKAKRELNEDPETREQAINDMIKAIEEKESEKRERERGSEFILYLHVHSKNSPKIQMIQNLKVLFLKKDPQFLLQFLRAKKFDQSRSLSLYLKHYMIRKDNPRIFFEDASPSTLRDILSSGALYVLDGRTHNGEKVHLIIKGMYSQRHTNQCDIISILAMRLSACKLNRYSIVSIIGILICNEVGQLIPHFID